MPVPMGEVFVHLVWATAGREPLIDDGDAPRLYAMIAAKCRALKCTPLAVGGTADHVHMLVELHLPVAVAMLAKEVKGASSHFMNQVIGGDRPFAWQGSYGAFSVRRTDVPTVQRYIARQREVHAERSLIPDLERAEA